MVTESIKRARDLRKETTVFEKMLWQKLRDRRFQTWKFRRQVPIGPYIADFLCHDAKLIIELDGGQHQESKPYDAKRTKYLNSQGYRVLRYWNNDVSNNLDGVVRDIEVHLT
ncbi:MAG: endonuclease domain-containing protein [Alphaproteobacteria bacterium]|nr:MAG: endonuclease domain-containing protein [Alphaproteobacteria bacterium]